MPGVFVTRNASATLECIASRSVKSVSWYKYNQRIASSGNIVVAEYDNLVAKGSRLTILNADEWDTGIYYCTVSSSRQSASYHRHLHILGLYFLIVYKNLVTDVLDNYTYMNSTNINNTLFNQLLSVSVREKINVRIALKQSGIGTREKQPSPERTSNDGAMCMLMLLLYTQTLDCLWNVNTCSTLSIDRSGKCERQACTARYPVY